MKNPVNNTPVRRVDREGFALATTVLVVLVLSVLAVAVVYIAGAEKKTSFAEGVHVSSVFSADAGGESAINFLRTSPTPPRIVDFADNTVRNQANTALHGSQRFVYDARYLTKRLKPGWGMDYLDYDYQIGSRGAASIEGESSVAVVASRLFKEGY